MEQNGSVPFTQKLLVAVLQARGYTEVSERQIATWRAKDILPPFDVIGHGLGKGQGKESSTWSDGLKVLRQALEICELLKMYRSYDDLYMPLWMLGFEIPLWRIREIISRPLDIASREIEVEMEGRSATEDVLEDQAYMVTELFRRANLKLFEMPKEILEAMFNLFLNSAYTLDDAPFEDGVKKLQNLDETTRQHCAEMFDEEIAGNVLSRKPNDLVHTIFAHAPFINKHLSLRRIREAVDQCTDEDLRVVHRDMTLACQAAFQMMKLLKLLVQYLPDGLKPIPLKDFIAPIFSAGIPGVWADLALRRSGYGPQIESYLSLAWRGLHTRFDEIYKEISEEMERENAGPQITVAIETLCEKLGVPLGSPPSSAT